MIRRILIPALFALLAALLAMWLANHPGTLSFVWFDHKVETSVAFVLIVVSLFTLAILVCYRVVLIIFGSPEAFAAFRRERRQRRGYAALSQGMIAVASGDAATARKLAKRARQHLDAPEMTLLLGAQAAQLEGDDVQARAYYEDMLNTSDTEFVGLRGLFLLASRSGDLAAARGYAEQAFELQPKTPWVFTALFELQSANGLWSEAAETLQKSVAAKLTPPALAKRRRAVLFAEEARSHESEGRMDQAFEAAQKAVEASPGLTIAAAIAARGLSEKGEDWRAAEIVERAWSLAPHPDLSAVYQQLKKNESDKAQAKWMRGLARFNKAHIESHLLEVAQDVKLGQWKKARKALTSLLEEQPSARAYTLMADVERALGGGNVATEEKVRVLLRNAVSAPRDSRWICDNCRHESDQWAAICPNCDAFDTMSWATIEMKTLTPLAEDVSQAKGKSGAVETMTASDSNGDSRQSAVTIIPPNDDVVELEGASEPDDVMVVEEVVREEKPRPKQSPTRPRRRSESRTPERVFEGELPPVPDDPGPSGDDPYEQ